MATSNNEWLQIYHDSLTGTPQPTALRWSGHATDATTVTAAAAAATSVSNQEDHITRLTNSGKRSRTSRRTPTTLLNADITNFRALVQQFTGVDGGSTAYMAAPGTGTLRQTTNSYSANSSGFDNYYGMGSRISPPAVDGYKPEVRQLPLQQYYTMMVDNGGAGGDLHQHGFVQRLQDGNEVAHFSGENNNGGKDNTCMY